MTGTLLLPDVSEFQSPADGTAPDWAGIKARNGGAAIIRVGYGNGHLDGMLVHNRATIKAHGFPFCGLYQYLRANQDAASQAHAFTGWIGPHLNPGEIPILDLEEGAGDQSGRANEWLGIIDAAYGLTSRPLSQRSWLYSGQDFAISAGLAPVFRSARRTWVAAYRSSEAGLLPHTLWQSTNGQAGANITDWPGCGRCDTSVYRGTLAQLAATVRGGTSPRTWTSQGQLPLHDLASAHLFTDPATVLALTARNSPGAVYEPGLAKYIDTVFAADCAKCPAGVTWHYPSRNGTAASWVTKGMDSLATLAAQLGTRPSAILQVTADVAADGKLQQLAAGYIDRVFAGSALHVPAGTVLFYGTP